MVFWRCLIAPSVIIFFTFGCGDGTRSSTKYATQVVQEFNVSQLLTEAQDSEKAQNLFDHANGLLDSQRYQDAIQLYDQAIALQPKNPDAWYNRGNALIGLQQYQAALEAYNKAIALQPNKHEAWINRGIVLTKMQKYSAALESYDQAIAIQPKKHQAYYNKACTYALQANVELAVENLEKAIKLIPGKYEKLAKTDPDFYKVRQHQQFKQIIQ